jgi:hypothetical protein
MIWSCLALLSSVACSESAATARDATSVVVPSSVIVRLNNPVLAVGTPSYARALVTNRDGATVPGPFVHWRVISGSEFLGIDRTGALVVRASGRG